MLDTYFDSQLAGAAHFALYPSLLPWVGMGYRKAELKILLLGESHYLPKGVSYHHNVDAWYSGSSPAPMVLMHCDLGKKIPRIFSGPQQYHLHGA